MTKKKKISKHISKKTSRKHDPLNTPLMRIVVTFVLGASVMLLIYKFVI